MTEQAKEVINELREAGLQPARNQVRHGRR